MKFVSVFFYSMSLLTIYGFGDASSVTSKNASEVVRATCEGIVSRYSKNGTLTFVFVLNTTDDFRSSFNYLWSLPHSQVYLSNVPFPLKDNDRVISISWERDSPPFVRATSRLWDLQKECGFRECVNSSETIDQLHLEKQILIQVRELKPLELPKFPPSWVRRELQRRLAWKYYYHRQLSTIVVLRNEGYDTVHSSTIIKRSGEVIGKTIMKLITKKLESDDVATIFDSFYGTSNRSAKFHLKFSDLYISDGLNQGVIAFNSCIPVSIQSI